MRTADKAVRDARALYRPTAAFAARLFGSLVALGHISPCYVFGLRWFLSVFERAVDHAPPGPHHHAPSFTSSPKRRATRRRGSTLRGGAAGERRRSSKSPPPRRKKTKASLAQAMRVTEAMVRTCLTIGWHTSLLASAWTWCRCLARGPRPPLSALPSSQARDLVRLLAWAQTHCRR